MDQAHDTDRACAESRGLGSRHRHAPGHHITWPLPRAKANALGTCALFAESFGFYSQQRCFVFYLCISLIWYLSQYTSSHRFNIHHRQLIFIIGRPKMQVTSLQPSHESIQVIIIQAAHASHDGPKANKGELTRSTAHHVATSFPSPPPTAALLATAHTQRSMVVVPPRPR
jgi:hypothetical protein